MLGDLRVTTTQAKRAYNELHLKNPIDWFRFRNQNDLQVNSHRRTFQEKMVKNHRQDAVYATMCSYLGLTARDVAELGGFSDRFARDLLAGRKSFPSDIKRALYKLYNNYNAIIITTKKQVAEGNNTLLIFRTNEELRASSTGKIWPKVGKAEGGFVGPYRAAMFEVFRWSGEETLTPAQLVFSSAALSDG